MNWFVGAIVVVAVIVGVGVSIWSIIDTHQKERRG